MHVSNDLHKNINSYQYINPTLHLYTLYMFSWFYLTTRWMRPLVVIHMIYLARTEYNNWSFFVITNNIIKSYKYSCIDYLYKSTRNNHKITCNRHGRSPVINSSFCPKMPSIVATVYKPAIFSDLDYYIVTATFNCKTLTKHEVKKKSIPIGTNHFGP